MRGGNSVGLYARYATAVDLSFDYAVVPLAHKHMHAQLPLYTRHAPLAASLSPSESQTTQELKKGVSYTTPYDLARKNSSRVEKKTDTGQ
jgi:hypothetical protein